MPYVQALRYLLHSFKRIQHKFQDHWCWSKGDGVYVLCLSVAGSKAFSIDSDMKETERSLLGAQLLLEFQNFLNHIRLFSHHHLMCANLDYQELTSLRCNEACKQRRAHVWPHFRQSINHFSRASEIWGRMNTPLHCVTLWQGCQPLWNWMQHQRCHFFHPGLPQAILPWSIWILLLHLLTPCTNPQWEHRPIQVTLSEAYTQSSEMHMQALSLYLKVAPSSRMPS